MRFSLNHKETNIKVNVGKEIAAMEQMAVGQLRDHYSEVFGETTNARNKQWLLKKIMWRLQSQAEGDLSERARARALEIASDDLPWNPIRLEQRFGRIHRIVQVEVCHLWNLVAKETGEGDVYHRLLENWKSKATH